MNQMCFVSPHWVELSLFPWQAQSAARVNDVIAGRTVQSALVPALSSINYSPALQVLAESHSKSRASSVDVRPISV